MIKIGEKLPDVTLYESLGFGDACPLSPEPVSTRTATKGKRVVVFGLPGAYTPTCSAQHVPGYVDHLADFHAKKVDEVWCVSLNDGYVMAAWGRDHAATGVRMLGDGNGELTKQLGLEDDLSKYGLGLRMKRFSMLVEDGVVTKLNVEAPGKFTVSDAATMLTQLG